MNALSPTAVPSALALAGIGADWLAFNSLLALRVAATFVMTPVLYAVPLPISVRLLLGLALSFALASGLAVPAGQWIGGSDFLVPAMAELALGSTLGLGILLAFAAFSIAGQLLDVELGFGIRPHGSLGHLTPSEFAKRRSDQQAGGPPTPV